MPAYIDVEYYEKDYMGIEVDSEELPRYIKRASDVIDQVTQYKINHIGFDNLSPFVQEQVKKATAAQVEFFEIEGGTEVSSGLSAQRAGIGNFNYTEPSSGSESENRTVSALVIEHLKITGLLYSGLRTC